MAVIALAPVVMVEAVLEPSLISLLLVLPTQAAVAVVDQTLLDKKMAAQVAQES